MENKFKEFIKSGKQLEIWNDGRLIFQSEKEMVGGLLDFIKEYDGRFENLVVFDTKAGNAVALLCAYLKTKEIYALLGSEAAKRTLDKFGVRHHFLKTIPNILNRAGDGICPLEKKSLGKNPEEFYSLII